LAPAKPPQETKPKPKTSFDPLSELSKITGASSSRKPKPDKPEEPKVLYFSLIP
jgi:hypothetical protein